MHTSESKQGPIREKVEDVQDKICKGGFAIENRVVLLPQQWCSASIPGSLMMVYLVQHLAGHHTVLLMTS